MGEQPTTAQGGNVTGPRVTRTPEAEAAVKARYRRVVASAADDRFRAEITRWAAFDDAAFPVWDDVLARVAGEVDTLCRALGPWAAVDPSLVFPPSPQRRERGMWVVIDDDGDE